jgi:hypothetical protein
VHVDWVRQEPPGIPTTWWRGVGVTRGTFVVESFIDELATDARADPLAYRIALLDKNSRAKTVLQMAAERSGWGKPLAAGQGRDVNEVLAGARTALGGPKLAAVKTLTAVGRTVRALPNGTSAESEFEMALDLPDKYLMRSVLAAMGNMSVYRNSGFNGGQVIDGIRPPLAGRRRHGRDALEGLGPWTRKDDRRREGGVRPETPHREQEGVREARSACSPSRRRRIRGTR